MARIRTIKPAFFRHRRLFLAEMESGLPLRVAFAGLWTVADRSGRFRWEPDEIKLDCLPYDEVDFLRVLDGLLAHGFIIHYVCDDREYGVIPGFKDHQVVNVREAKSQIPEPPTSNAVRAHANTETHVHAPNGVNIPEPLRQTIIARDVKCVRCESTKDLTVDHIFPRSIGGTHAPSNLRTLCRPCNSRRPVAGQGLIDDLAKDGLTLNDMQRICTHMHAPGEGKGREGEGEKNAVVVERGKSIFREADFELTYRIMGAWGLHEADPRVSGTTYFANKWLSGGWQADLIVATIERVMAKRDKPPNNLRYFEQAIADAHAELARPVPEGSATGPPSRRRRTAGDIFFELDAELKGQTDADASSTDLSAGPGVILDA